jgi:streptomycin 6-kinase
VRVIDANDTAVLMERADGPRSLTSMAVSGSDVEAAEILAETVLQLHAPRAGPIPSTLVPLKFQFGALFTRAVDHEFLARCATVARHLLATPHDAVPLHGDLHHGNVLDGEGRGWLAVDPKGLIGERTYANLLKIPGLMRALSTTRAECGG